MKLNFKKIKRFDQSAFTMVELLVYVSLLVIISTIFFAFSAEVIGSLTRLINNKELYQNSRFMLATMGQDIKTAKEILELQPERITLLNKDEEEVIYYYDADQEKVFYQSEGVDLVLGSGMIKVTALSFEAVGSGAQVNLIVEPVKPINYRGGLSELSLNSIFLPRNLIY